MLKKCRELIRLSSACGLGLTDWLRLRRRPRLQGGRLRLFGQTFGFVDAGTLLSGLREIFLEECYRFRATGRKPRIIDCGANIGLSVFYFKRMFPEARITAFEADPTISGVLRANLAAAGYAGVEIHDAAVWTENSRVDFRPQGGASGRIAATGDTHNLIGVDSVRLRDWLADPVDLLKLDIEGAEAAVITDCADRLQNVERIFLEYHSPADAEQTLDEILGTLRRAGLRYSVKTSFAPAHPFVEAAVLDGMDLQLNIHAWRPERSGR